MSVLTYPCPCCGAPLRYAGGQDRLQCDSCGNSFDLAAVQSFENAGTHESITFEEPQQQFSPEEMAAISGYVCQNCGAELMTDATTTATVCPYCGSAAVLPDQIAGGVKPELVVPFRITKEQAVRTFQEYFAGKRLLPNIFLNSANRIAELRQLYVPYWLFDCEASADMTFDATRSHVLRDGEWEVIRTDHFAVRRSGTLRFERVPVDGSRKLDDRISESLEPYDLSDAVPFQPAVLAGAMADRADVDAAECERRVAERVKTTMAQVIRDTVTGYETVSVRGQDIRSSGGRVTPALMPVWLITTEKTEIGQKKIYTFAINGQSGRLTCDVPYDGGKATKWFLGVFAGVFAAGYAIMRLLLR